MWGGWEREREDLGLSAQELHLKLPTLAIHVKPHWKGWNSGLCPQNGERFQSISLPSFPSATKHTNQRPHLVSLSVFLNGKACSREKRSRPSDEQSYLEEAKEGQEEGDTSAGKWPAPHVCEEQECKTDVTQGNKALPWEHHRRPLGNRASQIQANNTVSHRKLHTHRN